MLRTLFCYFHIRYAKVFQIYLAAVSTYRLKWVLLLFFFLFFYSVCFLAVDSMSLLSFELIFSFSQLLSFLSLHFYFFSLHFSILLKGYSTLFWYKEGNHHSASLHNSCVHFDRLPLQVFPYVFQS